MKKGFTLMEVMISLCIVMICVVTLSKLMILAFRSKSYSECLTHAVVLGHSKLVSLESMPITSPDLSKSWHQDLTNPLNVDNREYYRFWIVDDAPQGKEVSIYVAWHDQEMGRAGDFGSLEDLNASRCPRIELSEFISKE
jgi:Tfp pilus assembly protein PilV